MDVELFGGGEEGDRFYLKPVVARVTIAVLNMTAQLEYLLAETGVESVASVPEVRDMRHFIGDFLSILQDTAAMNDAEAAVLEAARVNTVSRDIAGAAEDLAEMNNSLWSLTTALALGAPAPNEFSRPRRVVKLAMDAPITTHIDQGGPHEEQLLRRDSRAGSSDNHSRPDDPPLDQDEEKHSAADTKSRHSKSSERKSKPPRTYTYLAPPLKPLKPPSSRAKAVLIGSGHCGKTSAISSFIAHNVPSMYVPTTIADHLTQAGSIHNVEMTIIDTAGLEEYDRLRPLSYANADIVVICFSIGCPQSLRDVKDRWLPEYNNFTPSIPLIVLGLKSDLRHEDAPAVDDGPSRRRPLMPVSYAQGLRIARAAKAVAYVECSARSGHGLRKAFDIMADLAAGWKEKGEEEQKEGCTVM
ncbi:hypothetical protein GP486_003402 [Trichoglossum hirsutum]|uniref:Uncharacterized protein n=1 Tax=Trichoglossum hirsutum TaxID=265104 RepID=A0A9P8LD66_9PEZI|nr:hypothetical protein GP486_003402 [Trichoglossum hirsutum]